MNKDKFRTGAEFEEDINRLWEWKSYKLIILGFGVFNISTGEDLFELSITTKEPGGIKTLNYYWEPEELEKFYKDISSFNEKVSRIKDIKDKMIVYNCGERKMQTSLYFRKGQWQKFYNTLKIAYEAYLEQKKIYAGF